MPRAKREPKKDVDQPTALSEVRLKYLSTFPLAKREAYEGFSTRYLYGRIAVVLQLPRAKREAENEGYSTNNLERTKG